MKKQFHLQGLDCAICAQKVEDACKKIEGVDYIRVNFASMKMTLEAKDEIFGKVFEKVVRVSQEVEPEMKISHTRYRLDKEEKFGLWRVISSVALFAAAKLPEVFGILEEDSPLFLIFCIAAYIIAGYDVVFKALSNIVRGRIFDENFLMMLASVGAAVTGEYSEAAAVMALYRTGEFLQDLAVSKSRRSVTELMDIRPDHANLSRNGKIVSVSPEEVPEGSVIIVKPGEKVPIDGVVLSGTSFLDTAMLTGESAPREVNAGDGVLSGSVNMNGVLEIKTAKTFSESSVSKILSLIENSDSTKSKTENFITKFAKYYTPAVVALAAVLGIVFPLIYGDWSFWIHKAVTCLVISCPCALVISVPLSFFGGIGGASSIGILIKGADSVEKLAKAGTFVFDKTGTLTKGNFTVTAIHPEITDEERLLELAAACENFSDHPISLSLKAAFDREIDRSRIGKVSEMPGKGVKAEIDSECILVGNEKLMEEMGITIKECPKCGHSGTVVHISTESVYLGHIVVSDEIKDTAKEAITGLKKAGAEKIYMFSGDRRDASLEVAEKLGIESVKYDLLPQDKLAELKSLSSARKNGNVVFIGDGVNDVPVLCAADVGIAMGKVGADAAVESADVVITDDHPEKVTSALRIAKKTLAIVYENIIFSIGVKLCVLIPNVVMGEESVPTWLAIFADVGVCIIAVLNAARALKQGGKH